MTTAPAPRRWRKSSTRFSEVVRIVGVGSASGCLQLWDFSGLAVLFGELLDPPPTDLELLSNHRSVHAVLHNSLTDPGSVILSKFHLTWLIVRQNRADEIFGGHYIGGSSAW